MTKKERYRGVIAWFEEHMPVAETELHYTDPFQLLVAVILSAQCTDKRVNLVTPALFEAYPTAEVMAEATPEAVFEFIRSVSYPNNKAKHLVGAARMLRDDFGGSVPDSVEELMKLPGVGQDGQRGHLRRLPSAAHGRRYARLPRGQPHRPDQ